MFAFFSGCFLVALGFLLGRACQKTGVVKRFDDVDRADWWKRGEEPPEYGG